MLAENVLRVIGNTPIVKLNKVVPQNWGVNLYAKLEFMNPGGSIKDRIGEWLITDAEKRGAIKPGGTIVECTSGNTGVALAMAAAIKGYKCVFVLPDKMSNEKIRNLRAFGARVVVTPTSVPADDPRSYYSTARRIADETPNSVHIHQYNNLANRECHEMTTGPEILRQMPEIDVFIAGIGTGGTLCGIARHLKKNKPTCQVVGVDPDGSIVMEFFKTGVLDVDHARTYKIEGIGEDFIPANYDLKVVDDMVRVEDKESFIMTRDLLTKEGLYAGTSSGAAVVGAIRWIQSQGAKLKGKNVLVVLPDSGNRYTSKAFDDDWMREAGFLDNDSLGTVADLMRANHMGQDPIQMVPQTEKISAVIELLREKGISQVPVSDEKGWIKGIVTETALLNALYMGKVRPNDLVDKLADPGIEFVTPEDPLEKVSAILQKGKIPLINDPKQNGKLIALVTKIDLISYLGNR